MSTTYRLSTAEIPRREYKIPSLPAGRTWSWLRRGWADLVAAPAISLAYGLLLALVGFLLTFLLIALDRFFLVPIFAAGFFILAPLLAVGLYSVAKLHGEGRSRDRAGIMANLRTNAPSIGGMGVVLLLIFINWIMLSNLLFGGVFHEIMPAWDQVKPLPVMFAESAPFLAVYGGIAVVLAILVFRMTAVALPMLVDDEIDAFNAVFASWKAVGENAATMTTWAATIFVLTLIGFLTFYLGLILILPWLGYASWHAYRDTLVLQEGQPSSAKS